MRTPHCPLSILAFGVLAALLIVTAGCAQPLPPVTLPYVIVDTGQTRCTDEYGRTNTPLPGQPFYGQDAQYSGPQPAYRDNRDGTVSDLNTGLMWVQARGAKVTWETARAGAADCRVGGHTDWRMPTIKELYSLINFDGGSHFSAASSVPYLEVRVFEFAYGDEAHGERLIDCQDWSATRYVSTTMSR
ncbi:MAG: DUF1566 domain-containing protein [Armatimonadota bacterium]